MNELQKLGFTSLDIPLTQGRWTTIDLTDAPTVLAYRWSAWRNLSKFSARWYARAWDADKRAVIYLHKLLTGAAETDHGDGNGLNNRRFNLRVCTRAQNNRNRRPVHSAKSGFRGVHRRGARFKAFMSYDGRTKYLGSFATPEEAAKAYDAAVVAKHGEFAITNAPTLRKR